MQDQLTSHGILAGEIIDRIETLLLEAERLSRPLELEPYRGSLFELFVMAEAAGCLEEEVEHSLSCDAISRQLATRWGLSAAAQDAMTQQSRLDAVHLSKMRILWSFLRMWMEWTYAWQRWEEFHQEDRR